MNIFDDRGFLTKEGKEFVDEIFTSNVKKVFDTASDEQAVIIVSSILCGLVKETASCKINNLE